MKKNIIYAIIALVLILSSLFAFYQINQIEKKTLIKKEYYSKPEYPYGYSKLNNWQKKLYDILDKTEIDINDTYELDEEKNIDEVDLVLKLYMFNNPNSRKIYNSVENTIPYSGGGVIGTKTTNKILVTHEINLNYDLEVQRLKEANEKADKIIAEIIDENDSDYDKLYKIYNYMINHTKFDSGNQLSPVTSIIEDSQSLTKERYEKSVLDSSAYGALVYEKAVCTGFAKGFYMLARKANIYVLYVTSNKLEHAWNIVWLDGNYYMIDVQAGLFLFDDQYVGDPIGNIEMPKVAKAYKR